MQDGATQIVGRSVDGFTAGFPTEVGLDGRTALVAVAMNGEPLPAVHGFPARLVVAGLYGYVSATKWLDAIELTTWEDFDGYWIPRGWSKEGPIKTASRIDVPRSGATVDAGTQADRRRGVGADRRHRAGSRCRSTTATWREADARRRGERQHVGAVVRRRGTPTSGEHTHPGAGDERRRRDADRGAAARRRPTAPPAGTPAPSAS